MEWELKRIQVSKLKEWSKNPRALTEKGMADLKKSIERFGMAEPLVVNTDLTICGGHGRKKALEQMGIKEVDCYLPKVQLTEKQFEELNIRLNKNIAGEFDFDILANSFELNDLLDWGFEEKELDLSMWQESIPEEQLDEVPETPKEAVSQLGDLFVIDGKHRVLCGDSTDSSHVEALMAGIRADMAFIDPPYNIAYEGGSKKREMIKNDKVDNFYQFLFDAYTQMLNATKGGASVYVTHADTERANFTQAFKDAGFYLSSVIIWVKNNSTFGRQDYKWKHEPMLYGWNANGGHQYYGPATEDTTWFINRPAKSDDHPTMKPVELIERALRNSSKTGDYILDLFGGSGSTLIACQQTNRINFSMELDPIYIDVILKRYKNLYPGATFECVNREFDFNRVFNAEN